MYDDRLEIASSGSLHFGLTPEMLYGPHESRPWNPLIARTFYRRGIIEEWRSGTLKMADLANTAGLPMPEIEDEGGAVIVRFRPVKQSGAAGTSVSSPAERRDAILSFLDSADDGLSRREIHALLGPGVSERQVRRELTALSSRGLIASTGHGPLTRWLRASGTDRGQRVVRHGADRGQTRTDAKDIR